MLPDWFKQIKQPSDEKTQEYLPRHPFKIILPFLILALLCCLWALLASHLGALDDHVSIGGKYFDLRYTSFELTPINDQQTKLTLKIDYRISTEVNFYANQIAQLMVHDFSNVILDFYKNRSEQAVQQSKS